MEKDHICVFCGEKPGMFQSSGVVCGGVYQFACKACEREMRDLDEAEVCRRALRFGRAEKPERLEERIQLITEAEDQRPACLRCGTKLIFGRVEQLDNSPYRDNLMTSTFEVQPAYCESCGMIEFYHPAILRKNKYLAYLARKDGQE